MIGEQLKTLRKQKKLTQAQLCEMTGIAASTISQIESGKRNVAMKTVIKLADKMGGKLKIC